MVDNNTFNTKLILKWTLIGSLAIALSGCSFFRDRETDYLRVPVYQTEGIKVPESMKDTTTINPITPVPDGKDRYDVVKQPDQIVPPNYDDSYPLELLKLIQGRSFDASLTFVPNNYGLIVIEAPLDEAYNIVKKELSSIPNFKIVKQDLKEHSFELSSAGSKEKNYWLYLTAKDKTTRLSVFDKDKNLIADDDAYSILNQLNSRIKALFNGGDSKIQVQFPLNIREVSSDKLTVSIDASTPSSLEFIKAILSNIGYQAKENAQTLSFDVITNQKDKNTKPIVDQFNVTVTANEQIGNSQVTIKSISNHSNTTSIVKKLANDISENANKTFLAKKVSLVSVSSQVLVNPTTKKALLIVPMTQDKVWDDVEKSIKASAFKMTHIDDAKQFLFVAPDGVSKHEYLIYVRSASDEDIESVKTWLGTNGEDSDSDRETYVQVFDKDGNILPLERSKIVLITLQNNL